MSDVHERLRRLLFLVPYISKHPGISLEELARALSLTPDQLLKELDLLTMVGRPPFQPDDYIDIYVENDRVYVDLDQRFSAPPRLTAAEATALTAAAELLKPAAGGALQSALAKLEKVLPADVRSRFRDMERKIDANVQGSDEFAPLAKAIFSRREVTFAYFSQGRGAVEQRRARPLELFSHRGQWYLHAYCLSRKDQRLFYVRERFGQTVRTMPDGGAEVNVAGDSERWLVQWILSFGGEAEVLGPDWAREAVARAATTAAPKAC